MVFFFGKEHIQAKNKTGTMNHLFFKGLKPSFFHGFLEAKGVRLYVYPTFWLNFMAHIYLDVLDTVDGRNPAPVDR